jgi:hypothetical protein
VSVGESPTLRISFWALFHVAFAILFADTTAANAQEVKNRQVIVQAEAEELPSAYGAPPDLSSGFYLP